MNDDLDINLPADADDLSKHAPALFALKGTETARPDDDPFGRGGVVPALYFEELSELVIAKTSIPEDGGLVVSEKYFEELPAIVEAKTFLSTFDYAQSDNVTTDGLTVPENYFEELSSIIEAKTIIPAEDGLAAPEKYFEEFGANLEAQIALEAVLPPFDYAQVDNTIPEGYFSEMENELRVHIALDNVKQDEGFVVPEGYFENLTSRIIASSPLDGVYTERSRSVQDDATINDDEVPAGYFDQLHDKIVSRIDEEQPEKESGKVIALAQWKKYTAIASVAASVAAFIVFALPYIGNADNGNRNLQFASNTNSLVPDNYVHVTPQPKIDTIAKLIVAPDAIVNVKIPKNPPPVKPPQQNEVIMNNEEIIAQSDLMDESMVMDFVAESEMIQSTDEVLDADMMEYLMNDNTGLEIFDPGNKKP